MQSYFKYFNYVKHLISQSQKQIIKLSKRLVLQNVATFIVRNKYKKDKFTFYL